MLCFSMDPLSRVQPCASKLHRRRRRRLAGFLPCTRFVLWNDVLSPFQILPQSSLQHWSRRSIVFWEYQPLTLWSQSTIWFASKLLILLLHKLRSCATKNKLTKCIDWMCLQAITYNGQSIVCLLMTTKGSGYL